MTPSRHSTSQYNPQGEYNTINRKQNPQSGNSIQKGPRQTLLYKHTIPQNQTEQRQPGGELPTQTAGPHPRGLRIAASV